MAPDKIKPEHNPWYLLATLHGEVASADDEVHARNRTAWNRFMAAELTEGDRTLLIDKKRCSAEDLVPFSAEELAEVEKLFAERHRQARGGDSTGTANLPLPDLKRDRIDFSNVEFEHPFWATGFLFPIRTSVEFSEADFSGATFSGWADFSGATFSGWADFSGAIFSDKADANFSGAAFYRASFWRTTFSKQADFNGATFSGEADFVRATFSEARFCRASFTRRADFRWTIFSEVADFLRAEFSDQGEADFLGATFSGLTYFLIARFSGRSVFSDATFAHVVFSGTIFSDTDFSDATFSSQADFSGATFKKEAVFVNAKMEGPTSFENAKFRTAPPHFFGATLHEGTVWRGVTWPPPPRDPKEAGPFVNAYERLKLEMDRLKKHEDELDFFALEMQSRRVLQGDWKHVSELRVFRRTIPIPPFKIPEKTITPRPRKLFGRTRALPSFTIKARTLRLFRPAPGLAIALYGGLSNYGRSYVRPLCWLLATVLAGILPSWWHLSGFWQATGLSLANTLGVFGFRRELIDPETLTCLPGWLKAFAAAQTIAGIVLLFLVGLAIRNRFRMK